MAVSALRRAARHALAGLSMATRLRPLVPRGHAVVLRYCRVAGTAEEPRPRAVTEEEFEAHLRVLTARARVVQARDIAEAAAEGRPLPRGAVAITFDGGYEDNCSAALPLLKRYGVPATFFVAAGWVETHEVLWWDRLHAYVAQALAAGAQPAGYEHLPSAVAQALAEGPPTDAAAARALENRLVAAVARLDLSPEDTLDLVKSIGRALGAQEPPPAAYDPMNWEQVAILRDGGMDIGSHAVSDVRLTAVQVQRAFEELSFSKTSLERKLGAPVDLVAYPEGRHNADVADLAEEAGYRAAFTTDGGAVRPGDPPLALRRIDVCGRDFRGAWSPFSPSVFALQLRRLARRDAEPG